jgi:hypothetical protein
LSSGAGDGKEELTATHPGGIVSENLTDVEEGRRVLKERQGRGRVGSALCSQNVRVMMCSKEIIRTDLKLGVKSSLRKFGVLGWLGKMWPIRPTRDHFIKVEANSVTSSP